MKIISDVQILLRNVGNRITQKLFLTVSTPHHHREWRLIVQNSVDLKLYLASGDSFARLRPFSALYSSDPRHEQP
jgi:hypothetical protein